MIEVLSGVKAGDRIVRKPTDKMRNSVKIKILEK
jgi:hypothetical protein